MCTAGFPSTVASPSVPPRFVFSDILSRPLRSFFGCSRCVGSVESILFDLFLLRLLFAEHL